MTPLTIFRNREEQIMIMVYNKALQINDIEEWMTLMRFITIMKRIKKIEENLKDKGFF